MGGFCAAHTRTVLIWEYPPPPPPPIPGAFTSNIIPYFDELMQLELTHVNIVHFTLIKALVSQEGGILSFQFLA